MPRQEEVRGKRKERKEKDWNAGAVSNNGATISGSIAGGSLGLGVYSFGGHLVIFQRVGSCVGTCVVLCVVKEGVGVDSESFAGVIRDHSEAGEAKFGHGAVEFGEDI